MRTMGHSSCSCGQAKEGYTPSSSKKAGPFCRYGQALYTISPRKINQLGYYRDTARYLYRHLNHPDNPDAVAFCQGTGGIAVPRMDSAVGPKESTLIIQGFAPKAKGQSNWIGTDRRIDILIQE